MKVTRDWRATPYGLELTTTAFIEGESFSARTVHSDDYRMMNSGVPAQYIEREHRALVMREVEKRLFGPRQ
jgi:hypothetical protein